jgi:hypothetical protein
VTRSLLLLVVALVAGCRNDNLGMVRPRLAPPGSPVDFGTMPVLNEKTVEVELTNLGRAKLSITEEIGRAHV